jgi:hypothetical protein
LRPIRRIGRGTRAPRPPLVVVRWSFVGMFASDEVAGTQAPCGCREDGECPGDHDRERGPGRQVPVGAAEDASVSAGEREEATDFRDRLEYGRAQSPRR